MNKMLEFYAASSNSISLHVHVSNDEAIQFYGKYGFTCEERVANYYRPNVQPPDAFLLRKYLGKVFIV